MVDTPLPQCAFGVEAIAYDELTLIMGRIQPRKLVCISFRPYEPLCCELRPRQKVCVWTGTTLGSNAAGALLTAATLGTRRAL